MTQSLFAIIATDNTDTNDVRQKNYPAHIAFLDTAAEYGVEIVISGPLMDETNTAAVGSLLIVQAATKGQAEKFNQADPFYKAGLWSEVRIQPFKKRRG